MKDKRILIVYTGGTICSIVGDHSRELNVDRARSVIIHNFKCGASRYAPLADELFEDSHLEMSTLSENVTVRKQACIIENLKKHDLSEYKGVIVLHGTDTLAYTAALLSLVFCDSPVPIMAVSANRPPSDPKTNANDNFRVAVEFIMESVPANVYAPYRNSDGTVYLHVASTLMQCQNFSEDFYNASEDRVFPASDVDTEKLQRLSDMRNPHGIGDCLSEKSVLLIHPYVGFDYSRVDLTGITAVVHGTYHSGTVCVERSNPSENYGSMSVLYLADRCRKEGCVIYAAPSTLGSEQYSSVYDAVRCGGIVPLNMTAEAAYAKAMLGTSAGYAGDALTKFLLSDICGEIIG